MSFQAVTWAIEQRAGGPSAKATLWSIANYANEYWCAWPSQRTMCEESEQSPDAIQKRLPELEELGLIRRIPLRFAGRKTVHFVILEPSPLFEADLGVIEDYLPRGCTICPKYVAANSGNAASKESTDVQTVTQPPVAAVSGNAELDAAMPALPPTLPQTLPRIAANVAALERQQEPVMEPSIGGGGGGAEHPRPKPIGREAFDLCDRLAAIAGFPDHGAWPIGWHGAPSRVQTMLDHGWQPSVMIQAAEAVMSRKRDGPPESLRYFEKPFARAHAQAETPLPTASEVRYETAQPFYSGRKSGPSLAVLAVARARAAGAA